MKDDETYYKARLEFARNQRLIALVNSFEIIDAFAQPTLNPDDYGDYERIKQVLLQEYSKDTILKDGILPT